MSTSESMKDSIGRVNAGIVLLLLRIRSKMGRIANTIVRNKNASLVWQQKVNGKYLENACTMIGERVGGRTTGAF